MKVALICSIPELELTKRGSMHMILTHIALESEPYRRFYASQGIHKIIDNSLFELGRAMLLDDVLGVAEQVKATEIVLPDVVYDGQATIKAVKQALDSLSDAERDNYLFMAVPQGSTEDEWWACFEELNKISDVDTIGFSKLSCPKAFNTDIATARLKIVKTITRNKWWNPNKQYHLLGASSRILHEIKHQNRHIRSIDTSAPFVYGARLMRLAQDPMPCDTKLDFSMALTPSGEARRCVMANIKQVVEVADGHRSK